MSNKNNQPSDRQESPDNRRNFVAAAATVLAGALALLTPFCAGFIAFLSPLFRKNSSSKVRVALLRQVPADGQPRSFPVTTKRIDAWTKYAQQRIGSVYLIRQSSEEKPTAFTAKCPHAGCFIGYTPGDALFRCPCHTSAFKLDGTRSRGDDEVAPRDMDQLPVELRRVATAAGNDDVVEVWVEFIEFQTGREEAIPTA